MAARICCYGYPVTDSSAALDHQIILAHDKHVSAKYLTRLLGLPAPEPQSIFLAVRLGNRTTLLFKTVEAEFPGQHYAFRVQPTEFGTILRRAQDMGLKYWSTPKGGGMGETYELDGETGFYFHDPGGHQLEVLTDTARLDLTAR